jgi:hypothetical protein
MKPLLAALATLTLFAALSTLSRSAPPPPDLKGFRSWTRVTKTPFPMDEVASGLCRPTPRLQDIENRIFAKHWDAYDNSIHGRRTRGWNYVHVYVNTAAREAIQPNGPKFPVGSVIVKEKFPGDWKGGSVKNDWRDERLVLGNSTVLTVMRKHEAGFDPKNGDWEYFVGDPKTLRLSTPDARALKTCQSCHALYKDRDFVTKTYLLGGLEAIFGQRKSLPAAKSAPQPH